MEGAEGSTSSSAAAAPLSFTMRMTVYGIQKAFPSVRNVPCSDVDAWRRNRNRNVVCVVSLRQLRNTCCTQRSICRTFAPRRSSE